MLFRLPVIGADYDRKSCVVAIAAEPPKLLDTVLFCKEMMSEAAKLSTEFHGYQIVYTLNCASSSGVSTS